MKRSIRIAQLAGFASAVVLSTVWGTGAWAAEPTLHEVYQAAETGHFDQADAMMNQVLKAHPNSAKAHFVEAELLAKEHKLTQARNELNKAEQLDASLGFAKPGALQSLKDQLNGTASYGLQTTHMGTLPVQQTYADSASHTPWGLLLAGAAFLLAVFAFLKTRTRAATATTPYTGGVVYGQASSNTVQPPFQTAPMGPQAPASTSGGMGSTLLGGLATGAAVGAGMVAGEALMHRVFDGGSAHRDTFLEPAQPVYPTVSTPANDNYSMGGEDFGVTDDNSWDDNSDSNDDWS